jgi:hypothetical protein
MALLRYGEITESNITARTNVLAVQFTAAFTTGCTQQPTGPKLHFLSVLCKRFYDDRHFNDARFKITRTSVNFNILVTFETTRAGQHTVRPQHGKL